MEAQTFDRDRVSGTKPSPPWFIVRMLIKVWLNIKLNNFYVSTDQFQITLPCMSKVTHPLLSPCLPESPVLLSVGWAAVFGCFGNRLIRQFFHSRFSGDKT